MNLNIAAINSFDGRKEGCAYWVGIVKTLVILLISIVTFLAFVFLSTLMNFTHSFPSCNSTTIFKYSLCNQN